MTRPQPGPSSFAALVVLLLGSAPSLAHAKDDTAALPAVPLTVTVTPESGGGPWKLRIENTGDVPVRITADQRLLVLDITPPPGAEAAPTSAGTKPRTGKATTPSAVRCILPSDARPASDEGRELVVPGKRSWSALIDPLLFCFAGRERAALVAGATVKAHFGWPSPAAGAVETTKAAARNKKPAATAPPFAAVPVGAAVGKHAPAKYLEGNTFTLGETGSGAAAASKSVPDDDARRSKTALTVSLPESLDLARGVDITTQVTVANTAEKPLTLLFRPETIRFVVSGPTGSIACGATRTVASPIRELFTTLSPKSRASTALLLGAVCPADTFDDTGIYRVTAIVDTTQASLRSIGISTWDDEARSKAPMLLRIRGPRRSTSSNPRPVLD